MEAKLSDYFDEVPKLDQRKVVPKGDNPNGHRGL
jgi:hypothetical protein